MTGGYLDPSPDSKPLDICEDHVNKVYFEKKTASVGEKLRKEIREHCETKAEFHVEEKKKEHEDEDDEFNDQGYVDTPVFKNGEKTKVEETVQIGETNTVCCGPQQSINTQISLTEFLEILPGALRACKEKNMKKCLPIKQLMENVSLRDSELQKYAFFDDNRLYTRNLLSTDDETYTLLLLCWTPGRESMIHDHPTDGCWMRCVAGNVIETLYEKNEHEHKMIKKKETWVKKDEVCYIDDSMGYHKVGNPCPQTPAASLHLYSPPFQTCRVWPNGCEDTDECLEPEICYYSVCGEKVQYECNN